MEKQAKKEAAVSEQGQNTNQAKSQQPAMTSKLNSGADSMLTPENIAFLNNNQKYFATALDS